MATRLATDQIADGTATSGYAPLSNGDGTMTWGPSGTGSDIHIEDDDAIFTPDKGVKFKDGADFFTSENASTDHVTYWSFADGATTNWMLIYSQQDGGATFAEFYVSGTSGMVEMYGTGDLYISMDGDIDARDCNVFYPPQGTSDPGGVAEGAMYYNSSTNKFRGYNGTTWSDLN